jgi:hypothetical protein
LPLQCHDRGMGWTYLTGINLGLPVSEPVAGFGREQGLPDVPGRISTWIKRAAPNGKASCQARTVHIRVLRYGTKPHQALKPEEPVTFGDFSLPPNPPPNVFDETPYPYAEAVGIIPAEANPSNKPARFTVISLCFSVPAKILVTTFNIFTSRFLCVVI